MLLGIFALLAALALSDAKDLAAQAAPPCSADSTARTALKNMIAVWTMAPSTDSLSARRRASLHLPVVGSTSQLTPVTSSTTCGYLRTAVATSLQGTIPDTLLSVVAVQVDTVYVAYDEQGRAGEFTVYGVYGSAYQELKRFVR